MTDAYSGSTVLVTGATGLIGSAIVYTLLEIGRASCRERV